MTLTGRLAFEHIECNVTSSAMTTKVYLDLVKAAKWKWISAIFQEMKCDQLSAAVVKIGVIDDEFIILCAQCAIRVIDVAWATIDTTFETGHKVWLFIRTHSFDGSRITATSD